MADLKLHLTEFTEVESVTCPNCRRLLPRRHRSEAWVEASVDEEWIAAYRLVPKRGKPVVGEIRLFPAEPRRHRGGNWSGEAGRVPEGGVPGKAVRELRASRPIEMFPLFVKNWERQHPGSVVKVLRRFGIASSRGVVQRRPGRSGRPNAYYALWAEAYVRLLEGGSRRPIVELAADPVVPLESDGSSPDEVSVAGVRDIIATARNRGLLTEAPPGRPGGSLTPKARRLLRKMSGG